MGHTYDGDPTLFPASVTIPDDGDDIDATNDDVAHEGELDRSATLARNLLPSGRTSFFSGVSVPNDLTAITTMVDLETRLVHGYGLYIYRSASTSTVDGTYVVNGNGSVGRWLHIEHATSIDRLIARHVYKYYGTAIDMTTTGTCSDPANRFAGHSTNVALAVLTSGTFACLPGDTFEIAYSVPFFLYLPFGGPVVVRSDVAVGVGYSATGDGLLVYPDELLDDSCSINADVDAGGRANGSAIMMSNGTADNSMTYRTSFVRTATFAPSLTGNYKFTLAAGCGEDPDYVAGKVNQGAMLSVTQRRTVIV